MYIRHSDQGGLKAERRPGQLRGQSDSWDASLMLTKLYMAADPSPPPVSCLCFPGGPFQWCAAVSNSAQAKSTPPKSSTPKNSRLEVRGRSERKTLTWLCVCVCVFLGESRGIMGVFHHYVCACVSQIWKLTLAYFSECLIPACEAFTSVPPREADDGFSQTHRRIRSFKKNKTTAEIHIFPKEMLKRDV